MRTLRYLQGLRLPKGPASHHFSCILLHAQGSRHKLKPLQGQGGCEQVKQARPDCRSGEDLEAWRLVLWGMTSFQRSQSLWFTPLFLPPTVCSPSLRHQGLQGNQQGLEAY